MRLTKTETEGLEKLEEILLAVRRRGLRRLSSETLQSLPALYRQACSIYARLESRGDAPVRIRRLQQMTSEAHGILYRGTRRGKQGGFRGLVNLVLHEAPRTIREEWRLLALTFGVFYGVALAAYIAVANDLSLAFSLFDAGTVSNEIEQLVNTPDGEGFRGNFTFGLGESPQTAAMIMVHNMGVGVLFFGAGLVPPFFLLVLLNNALMLGTYTAVASHWGEAGHLSSILWCHGTIELQALVLAAMAGIVLFRALLVPGPWTRSVALKFESRRAWALMAPVFPMLFVAGIIEGFVSPHFPMGIRLTVAFSTGLALILWVLLGGRGKR